MKKSIKLTQTRHAFLLSMYLGVVLNFVIFFRRYNGHELILSLPQSVVISVEIVCSFGFCFILFRLLSLLGIVIYRLLATCITFISVGASYYILVFHVTVGYGVVASVLNTHDIDLFMEIVSWKILIYFLLVCIVPVFIIWAPTINASLLNQIKNSQSAFKAFTILMTMIVMVFVPLKIIDHINKSDQKKYHYGAPSYSGTLTYSYLPINWLSGLVLYVYTSVSDHNDYKNLPNPAEQFHYLPSISLDDTYVIFIIGETTRGDHMGLLGYERDTTPLLAKEINLVAMQGRSCDTATKLSLRCMFVREGDVVDDAQRTLKSQNIFSTLIKLGFTSELFAMQGEVWFYSMLGVNNYAYREMIAAEEKNVGKKLDDMTLINKVNESLAKYPKGKHLIILHTKGSHYLYSARYSRKFAHYKPECLDSDARCSEIQYINAFDNSVLYTDYFIQQVINQVKDKKAIVFYASDHGESMSDGQHLHGTPRNIAPAEQFNIPLLVWMSEPLLTSPLQKQLWENLRYNSHNLPIHRHEELYDSILGCLGYQSFDGGINEKNNWCAFPNQ